MKPRAAIAIAAFAGAALFDRSARAFERQQHVGVDAGGAVMTTTGKSQLGLTATLHYTYGLSDAFNLVAEAGGATFGTSGATGPQPGWIGHGGVGVMYVLDVLRWVPYFGVIGGAACFGSGATDKTFFTPDVQLGVGVDYGITRQWAIGVAYRQHLFFGKTDTYPEYTSLALRAEYVWGW